jgi:hypothetical protein
MPGTLGNPSLGRIIGHVGVAAPVKAGPVADGDVIEAILVLRRAIVSGPYDTVRAIQSELAYLRRLARRHVRRAAA